MRTVHGSRRSFAPALVVGVLLTWCSACAPLVGAARRGEDVNADFYVARNGNDAWSGRLAEPNGDGTDGPFATPARAQEALRAHIAGGLTADATVLFREGTYYVPKGLAFGPADGGTKLHAVTWAAWPGETARLVGGVAVTGWTKQNGAIWRASFPEGAEPNQLFERGRRMPLARTPNEGYFQLEAAVKGKPKTAFVYRKTDLDPTGWDWSDGRVFLWPTHDWFSTDKRIAGIDAASRTILLDGQGGYDIRADNRYFVQNILALLDAPGECQISTKTRTLHCIPRAEPVDVVAATAESLLAIRGGGEPVRNLHFRGLDLAVARGDLVRIAGAEDCSIRACLIENAGERGVLVQGAAQRITLAGNLIRYHGLHGVELQGLAPGQPDVNHHHVVENNHIHHCGRLVGHGYGVRIQQSGHNRIVHNHIHHMPRYATTLKGTRYQVLRTQVKGVTFENRHDFLHSRNNLLAWNHIHHVNLDSQDTGAMESWGPGRDNVYDHNLIHDVGNTRFTLQSGLYLDDATDHFTVTNNIIYGIIGAGGDQPIYAKGIGNRIDNNILVVGPTNERAISSFFMADERCDHHVYTRNLVVFEGTVVKQGAFGRGIGAIHDRGTTRRWAVDVPADGDYHLWMRYAALNKAYGSDNMAGRFTMQADGGEPVTLQNLPDTGGWGVQKWSRCATLPLKKGSRTLTWTNVKGGGINWDAFVLTTDPDWKPDGTKVPPPAKGHALVVVQTELFLDESRPADSRTAWHFQNWSEDRVEASDRNLFWKPGGPILFRKARETVNMEEWQKRFDKNSVVADPQFVDLAGRDFRLKPTSPALKLGFEPIDTRSIGLKDDFPKRFKQ